MSNSKIWASSGVLYVSFFWNMLQYALIFESVLFTLTIIYITFLFSLGPLPLSPHLLFLPSISSSPSLKCISSLSLTSFLCSLSLSLSLSLSTPRHCLPLRQNSGRSIKPHHATPRHTNPIYTLKSPSTNTATQPDETQAGASSHVTPRHTNPIYTLRSPSTNTATQTRSTLSDHRPPTQPHKPVPPHPQQPMAWSPCHATPLSLSCHPPCHRNLPPSDFS